MKEIVVTIILAAMIITAIVVDISNFASGIEVIKYIIRLAVVIGMVLFAIWVTRW